MRVAAIYDIHGNIPALKAVLAEIELARPDLIVVGGDVAAGPMPAETLDRLMALETPADFVRGNGDRYMMDRYDEATPNTPMSAAADETTRWAAAQLKPEHRAFLGRFVERAVLAVEGLGEVLFCHATPSSDEPIMTVATPEERVSTLLGGITQPVVVCGHTHMQYDRIVGPTRLVNAGSVGMPYGEPGAYWALLGPDVELRRTGYDLEAAAAEIRRTAYPLAGDFAANNVLRPPSAAEALAYFAQADNV